MEAAANASELQQQGQALAQRMEQVKRQRENEHPDRHNNEIVYPPSLSQQPGKKKKMALTERYEQDRAAAVTASADTLAKVQALVRND